MSREERTEMTRKQRVLVILAVLFCLYLGTYLEFRWTHVEVSKQDKMSYVVFQENREFLYYLFLPLEFIDSMITDMGFHFGPLL